MRFVPQHVLGITLIQSHITIKIYSMDELCRSSLLDFHLQLHMDRIDPTQTDFNTSDTENYKLGLLSYVSPLKTTVNMALDYSTSADWMVITLGSDNPFISSCFYHFKYSRIQSVAILLQAKLPGRQRRN